jgi:1,2-diacylglycerol 3-alpha-glucosyltransferase
MNLLFVAPRYYPHVGGLEYVVKSVAERLVKKGHDVSVLCGESNLDNPMEGRTNGVYVYKWPVWAPGDAYHIPRKKTELKNWLLKTMKDHDVVHFHSVHSIFTIYCLEALRSREVRKVLTPYYHGSGHSALRKLLWKRWRSHVKEVLRFVDTVHTVSRLEAHLVNRDFMVKALPIENGVDEWILKLSWSPLDYVMYSGRIERYKNIHRLANIVKILNNNFGMNLELKVFGSGPFSDHLNEHLMRIGMDYRSHSSSQPFEQYIVNLSKASLFGLLSEKESYPQSINEANAIGVPVVVVEPWGLNFSERSRTLITRLSKGDKELAKELAVFLDESKKQPRPKVPTWSQVVDTYIEKLYCPRES